MQLQGNAWRSVKSFHPRPAIRVQGPVLNQLHFPSLLQLLNFHLYFRDGMSGDSNRLWIDGADPQSPCGAGSIGAGPATFLPYFFRIVGQTGSKK